MLEIKKAASHQKVSLDVDDCGDVVMLSLDNGDNCAFWQALDASDVGKVLGVLNRNSDEEVVCQGDLTALWSEDKLHFVWHSDGLAPQVILNPSDVFVFEEALKGWCRMLMRTKPGRALFP